MEMIDVNNVTTEEERIDQNCFPCFDQGKSIAYIADERCIEKSAIRASFERFKEKKGVVIIPKEAYVPRGDSVDIPKKKLEELLSQGLSCRKIGERFCCSDMTVNDRIRRYGLKTPRELREEKKEALKKATVRTIITENGTVEIHAMPKAEEEDDGQQTINCFRAGCRVAKRVSKDFVGSWLCEEHAQEEGCISRLGKYTLTPSENPAIPPQIQRQIPPEYRIPLLSEMDPGTPIQIIDIDGNVSDAVLGSVTCSSPDEPSPEVHICGTKNCLSVGVNQHVRPDGSPVWFCEKCTIMEAVEIDDARNKARNYFADDPDYPGVIHPDKRKELINWLGDLTLKQLYDYFGEEEQVHLRELYGSLYSEQFNERRIEIMRRNEASPPPEGMYRRDGFHVDSATAERRGMEEKPKGKTLCEVFADIGKDVLARVTELELRVTALEKRNEGDGSWRKRMETKIGLKGGG